MVDKERVLVTGASGLLGRYLRGFYPARYTVRGTYCRHRIFMGEHMDLRDDQSVASVIEQYAPHVVIHCAGEGSVDACERGDGEVYEIIVEGTKRVAKACACVGARLVYVSTNAVFDGEHAPYAEGAACTPVNKYGIYKLLGENMARGYAMGTPLIVRPIMLYGKHYSFGRTNWLTRLWAADGRVQHIVSDVVTQPTYASDVARVIWALVGHGETGIYHVGGADTMTLYEYAARIAEIYELESLRLQPVKSSHFPDLAPRPRDTTYDLTKLRGFMSRVHHPMPSGLDEGLRRVMREP